ncbi:MAG: tryptophan 7-halogenase [Pseudomonadota bacterium]
MSDTRPNRVVIAGRDAALWLTASVIQRALGPAGVSVEAIELPTRLRSGEVIVTQPAIEALHNQLRLDEAALLRTTGGSFSFGQNFVDSSGATPSFMHASGAYGAPIDGNAFFPYWVKARSFGLDVALEDFCLTAAAAKQGRMMLPDETTEIFGRTDYGYHLPALPYVATLKTLAARLGVVIHHTATVAAERDEGGIRAITLDDGRRIDGALFIDATGPEALLIGEALGVGRDAWRPQFGIDRRLSAQTSRFLSVPAYGEIRAWRDGWLGLFPSQVATHVVQHYSSACCSDEEALRAMAVASGLSVSDATLSVIDPSRRHVAWEGNCVAIGETACTLDPIHGVDLHAIQLGLVHLLQLFPVTLNFAAERAEYNRLMQSSLERIRDFQSAYYALNRYGDSPFWTQARAAARPEALTHKIATFQARGDIAPMEDESFSFDSWQALFVGLGLMPESWPPAIDRTPPERMKQEFRRTLAFVKEQVLKQPTHELYLDSFCRSEAA